MAAENANVTYPLLGFCIEFLLCSKYAQNKSEPKLPKALNALITVFFQKWAGRSVRYDRRVRNAEAAGSNPARSTHLYF